VRFYYFLFSHPENSKRVNNVVCVCHMGKSVTLQFNNSPIANKFPPPCFPRSLYTKKCNIQHHIEMKARRQGGEETDGLEALAGGGGRGVWGGVIYILCQFPVARGIYIIHPFFIDCWRIPLGDGVILPRTKDDGPFS